MLMENNKLQHLRIRGNKIGDDGLRQITEGLQHNNTLVANGCGFSVKGMKL